MEPVKTSVTTSRTGLIRDSTTTSVSRHTRNTFLPTSATRVEAKHFEELPNPDPICAGLRLAPNCVMSHEIHSIPSLSGRIEQLGVTKLVDARMAEEQGREVNHEIEQEILTHLWRPPRVEPAEYVIHPDILEFVQTGKVPETSVHISPLLAPLNMVKALNSTADWPPSPLATTDFMTTVLHSDSMGLTEYLRPVNWILASGSGKKALSS